MNAPQAPEASATEARASLRIITLVLAVACGLTVANLYYAQPLLSLIASSFFTSVRAPRPSSSP